MDAHQEMIACMTGTDSPPTQPESIEALKANLYYAERLKMKAFEEHKTTIIKVHDAMTALNNALLRKA